MDEFQKCKFVAITPPGAIKDNADFGTTEVDTLGFDAMLLVVLLGATDIAMAALKVTESDTSGSGHADVTGLVWGTSTNIAGATSALPSATDDNKFQIAHIDLRKRKRYIDLTATAGNGTNGTYLTAIAMLYKADDAPMTAAERGADEILAV